MLQVQALLQTRSVGMLATLTANIASLFTVRTLFTFDYLLFCAKRTFILPLYSVMATNRGKAIQKLYRLADLTVRKARRRRLSNL